jgi:hypothetical protein
MTGMVLLGCMCSEGNSYLVLVVTPPHAFPKLGMSAISACLCGWEGDLLHELGHILVHALCPGHSLGM